MGREDLVESAEAEWLEIWTAGPGQGTRALAAGSPAPDMELLDHTGTATALSSFWEPGPALLMFWRHFGCGCGIDRAARLNEEIDSYTAAGLNPAIGGQGEPERAAAYREKYEIDIPVLCDPDRRAYQAYGLGDFSVEQVLYDAPEEMWDHSTEIGVDFQAARRQIGRPLVDSPWAAPGEFVVDPAGTIRLAYAYQYCEDFPDARLFTTVAKRL